MNILLVDDYEDCLDFLRDALTLFGHTCDSFTVPELAVEEYRKKAFDLVITDMQMPGMNGIEVLKKIRELNSEAKVIIITANRSAETFNSAFDNRVNAFLNKPFDLDKLIETINKIENNVPAETKTVPIIENITSRGYIAKESGGTMFAATIKMAPRLFEAHDTIKKQAEQIWKNEEFIDSVLENIPDMVFVKDARDLRFVRVNRAGEELLGFSKGELIGKNDHDIFPKREADFFTSRDREALDRKELIDIPEETIQTRKLGQRILHTKKIPIMDANGDPLYLFGISKDITGHKLAEEALQKSQRQLADIIDFLPDATLAIDNEGRVIIWNRAIEKMTGIPASEMIGRGNYTYSIPFYGEARPQLIDLVLKYNENIAARYSDITREGDTIVALGFCDALYDNKGAWCFAKASPLHDQSGNIIGAIESIRDITEYKLAEENIKKSEQKYRNIYENSVEGIYQVTLDGKILTANSVVAKMAGYNSSDEFIQAVNSSSHQLFAYPEERIAFNKGLKEKLSVENYETEFILKNGEKAWGSLKARLVKGESDDQTYIEGLVENITERKKAEEKIKAALHEKEALLRELYHRTKNNMQVICALLELYSNKNDNSDLKNIFRDMKNRIHSMALVHQKLYKSNDLSNINLNEYAGELINFLMKSYNISPDRIALDLNIENISVIIDIATPCGLVLNELVSNSLKYAFPDDRHGKISLSISIKDSTINLRYSDDGVGLPHGFDCRNDGKMGMDSIISIVEDQLQGSISFISKKGLYCNISFPNILYKARV
ncbi:MAG: multi-sensor hybrid histidine kinase [uncultured bacterium]|nr:MAG: multi-sensor hybrid histidine kinase [uncultured bacterium]